MIPAQTALFLSITLLAKAGLFLAGCFVLGNATQGLIRRAVGASGAEEVDPFLRAFFCISTGMGVLTLLLFVLGIFSLLSIAFTSGTIAIALLGALVYQSGASTLGQTKLRAGNAASWIPAAQYVFFSGLFIGLVLLAIKPPGMWDDTMYHLPYARHYLQNQAILINPNLRFPLFPHNGNLLFSLGLMVGTETDAQVLATLPLFVMSLGLFGACQVLVRSPSAGYVAVILLLALGPVHEAIGYAYIDNILALYCWGAVLGLALWLRKGRAVNHWLVTSGVLAGSAAGTKLFGGVVAVVIGLYLVLAVRKLRPIAIYALSTLVFGIGWYVRSFYISGDPVHPAGGNIFGHFIWNAADLLSQQQEQSTHGVEKGLLHVFGALQKAGAVLLVPALFVVMQPGGRRKPVFFLYLCFVLYLLFWLYVTQVARYLSPIVALGALLSVLFVYQAGLGTSLRQLGRRWVGLWPRRAAALALGSCGLALALLSARTVPATLSNWDATLKGRSGYELMSAANALMPEHGTVLLQVGFENAIYFFNGTVIGDWFGPGRYNDMLRCEARCAIAPAAHMATLMKGFGAKMLAVNAKRFEFEPQPYLDYFEVKKQSADGYLLTLKK